MYEFIKDNQLNAMLFLCGACGILVFLLLNTRFLSKSRKKILIFMELAAFFLLWFDREAYVYAGSPGQKSYYMIKVSNFMVFFLTSAIVFGFNLYISDWLTCEGKQTKLPRLTNIAGGLSVIGMLLSIVAVFTDLYFYIDENNTYHRGSGFLIAYIIPVLCPLMQYVVIRQYRKVFSKLIYIAVNLYIFIPIVCAITQYFAYGISIVNMSMVAVSISMYIFTYLDINNTVEHAHEIEIQNMQGEQMRMQRLFDQTAMAFVSAVEKKDDFAKGKAAKVAECARKIAKMAGKSDDECEKVYYAALLHDVGLIGIPDSVIKNSADPSKWDYEVIRKKPIIGEEILSCITEYPYLSEVAHYSHERYNGTGYPKKLRGREIPEIARIVAVADAYVTMTSKKRYRDERPMFMVREAFVKGAGEEFDPAFSEIMVKIIDTENKEDLKATAKPESELTCKEYRENISIGIPVSESIKQIKFECEMPLDPENGFFAPSIVLFDSYDGRTHSNKKAIEGYRYLEYGEVWFDKHSITTAARKIEEKEIDADRDDGKEGSKKDFTYEILAGLCEDHMRLIMKSKEYAKEVIVALPNGSKDAFIGLTGENCRLKNIVVEKTGESVGIGEIPRIAKPISFIDQLESDIKNVQIDRTRSASTEGIEIKNKLDISFRTMSLPGASLVWHCPYIVLYSSDDGKINGGNYKEYALVKLNGENDMTEILAENKLDMKKKEEFPGWDEWKAINKKGMDCEISVERKGTQYILKTENLGIYIENIAIIKNENRPVYLSITGDQIALTDIRIMKNL